MAIASPIDVWRKASVVRRWQIVLIGIGLLLLLVGGLVLLDLVPPARYVGILLWFAGAIIVHDGIVAPVVFGVGIIMRRTGRRIPIAVLAIVQGAIVVAAIVTLIVVPEIVKQRIGTANPTVLPLDYVANLALFYAGLAVGTGIVIALHLAARRRRSSLPSPTARG